MPVNTNVRSQTIMYPNPNPHRFFGFGLGLGLGYIMVCVLTLACAQVSSVMLIKELALGADRIGSHLMHASAVNTH